MVVEGTSCDWKWNEMDTEVHSFSTLVVGDDNGRQGVHVAINQRFEAVRNRIVRVEDIIELGASRQDKVQAESINTAYRHKHGCNQSKVKKKK